MAPADAARPLVVAVLRVAEQHVGVVRDLVSADPIRRPRLEPGCRSTVRDRECTRGPVRPPRCGTRPSDPGARPWPRAPTAATDRHVVRLVVEHQVRGDVGGEMNREQRWRQVDRDPFFERTAPATPGPTGALRRRAGRARRKNPSPCKWSRCRCVSRMCSSRSAVFALHRPSPLRAGAGRFPRRAPGDARCRAAPRRSSCCRRSGPCRYRCRHRSPASPDAVASIKRSPFMSPGGQKTVTTPCSCSCPRRTNGYAVAFRLSRVASLIACCAARGWCEGRRWKKATPAGESRRRIGVSSGYPQLQHLTEFEPRRSCPGRRRCGRSATPPRR